jgi:hypothetical protein
MIGKAALNTLISTSISDHVCPRRGSGGADQHQIARNSELPLNREDLRLHHRVQTPWVGSESECRDT